jgi:hypothetical protein
MRRKTLAPDTGDEQPLSLSEAAHYLVEECRMVLPGIQALFGFQLIAVFNERFDRDLDTPQQCAHLLALALVAIATALIMAPAAYHREVEPQRVTARFLRLSTRLLLFGMVPLAAGVCLDFFLIAQLILRRTWLSALLALALFAVFGALWFWFPRHQRRRH